MINALNLNPVKFLTIGNERSLRLKWNVIGSLFFKGASIVCNIVSVPLLLSLLNVTEYGIWLTLSSIVAWVSFFDVGLGNGMRNKIAESLAKEKLGDARVYVSTTYAAVTGIVVLLLIIFLAVQPFLNWSSILNTKAVSESQLSKLGSLMVIFFLMRFIAALVSSVLAAHQRTAAAGSIDFVVSLLTVVFLLIIRYVPGSDLLVVGSVLTVINVLVPLAFSLWLFNTRFKNIAPSCKYIQLDHLKHLSSMGLQFFLIQIAAMLLFSTSNIIIIHVLDANAVAEYQVVYKYFSVIPMGFSIILNPFWSAFTEAYIKDDSQWMITSTKRLNQLWLMLVILAGLMVAVSDWIYTLWIGSAIQVSLSLSVLMAVFVIIHAWTSIYASCLNGIGKIKLQLVTAVAAAVINVPLAIILTKNMGLPGTVLSTAICLMPTAILLPYQFNLLIKKKAKGIYLR